MSFTTKGRGLGGKMFFKEAPPDLHCMNAILASKEMQAYAAGGTSSYRQEEAWGIYP